MGERRKKKYSESEHESESDSPSRSEDLGGGGGHRRKERGGSSRAETKKKAKRRRRSEKEKDRERRESKERRRRRDREASRRISRKEERRRKRRRDDSSSEEDSEFGSNSGGIDVGPEVVVEDMLAEFPGVVDDLKQLLQMIDNGQAVDIKGISEKALVSHLRKLFLSLNLKESNGAYLLPADRKPVLAVVGPLIEARVGSGDTIIKPSEPDQSFQVEPSSSVEGNPDVGPAEDLPIRRRIIGPAMPSAELLAAAAKLTEAQAELRDAAVEDDTELFIGPAPPSMVAEAESANEAERFEEVTRIMGADVDDPYDILGVNHKMSAENVKKRYWKLSLLVHPDKCSHPEAHQSFIKLNKAFKDVQDPDKRKALDDKIKQKEEEEAFKVELKAMREAAQWRRLQGISMEGDDELLGVPQENVAPKRDDWMTTLPPERNPNTMTMQSRSFGKASREGRGDTSVWTDTPIDRAQKAKLNYLEAYNETTALASNEEEKKKMETEADLVEMYNKAKRSKSLVQKHREESSSKIKSKQKQPAEKEDWAGDHPWKPWDREKDLTAGRQRVKFDAEQMSEGLSSRFSSGSFQRSFL